MFPTIQNLIAAHRRRPVLKGLWALGILTIVVFSIIYIDRLFDLIRGFEGLRAAARYIRQLITQIAEWDKVIHFAAYAGVALIGFLAVSQQKYRTRIAVGMIAMGIALEIAQLLVPGRTFEFSDWFSDILGVGVSYFFFSFLRRVRSSAKLA